MNEMTLTETLLIVNKGSPYYNIFDELCFLSKNLYTAWEQNFGSDSLRASRHKKSNRKRYKDNR